MGFRFRKSVKLFPGVRMNISTSGASLSLGGPGATVNLSKRGARATFGIPGTGLSYSAPVFRPQPGGSGGGPRKPIISTADLVSAVQDPGSTVVYRGSGRRLSAQQLAAEYRRLAQTEARERAQAEIDRMEAELRSVIDTWKEMPAVPTPEEYERALHPQPFAFAEEPPPAPGYAIEETTLRERVTDDVTAQNPHTIIDRLAVLGPALGAGALGFAAVWLGSLGGILAGIAALIVAAVVGIVLGRLRARRRATAIEAHVEARMGAEWPALRDEITRTHERGVAAFEARRSEAEAEWLRQEQERVEWAKRLAGGDVEAVHEAISASLADLDFPFDTQCAVGVEDESSAFLALDLPEIEDVIPETRYQVLKDGRLKGVKRKPDERNASYARLVTGLAFMMAAASFAAAPTLRAITIGAYTQRRRRGSQAVEDQYVYESRIARGLFAPGSVSAHDPVGLLASQQTRMQWGTKHDLKKIAPPPWTAELVQA